jgi:hypothetical protein
MCSAVRRVAGMILLIALLAPGFVQARPVSGSWDWASKISAETFLSKVWSLLAFWRGSDVTSKNGSGLDPAGQPPPPGTAGICDNGENGDNGSGLDPAGCRP